jgi:hypothetical protein
MSAVQHNPQAAVGNVYISPLVFGAGDTRKAPIAKCGPVPAEEVFRALVSSPTETVADLLELPDWSAREPKLVADLVHACESQDEAAQNTAKATLPGFVPAHFDDDCDGQRAKKWCLGRQVIGHDIDDIDATDWDDVVRQIVARLPDRYLAIHTTPRSTEKDWRVRVFELLLREATPAEWDARVKPHMRRMGCTDLNALDVTRFFYLPVQTPSYRYAIIEGPRTRLDELPLSVVNVPTPAAPPAAPAISARDTAAALLASAWPAKGRHLAQLALAGALCRDGWSEADAVEMLCAVCRTAGDEDRPKRAATCRDTWAAAARGPAYTGWKELTKYVGEPVVAGARAMLRSPGDRERATRLVDSLRVTSAATNGVAQNTNGTTSGNEPATSEEPDEGAVGSDGRQIIRHRPSRFEPDVLASVGALAAAGVYVGGPRLVQIVRASTQQQDASRWTSSDGRTRFDVVAGSPLISPIPKSVLKMKLSEVVDYRKYVISRGGWVESAPPDDVVAAVHELGNWNLPRVKGAAETPIFRADGSIADADGYDERTGYWIEKNAVFPAIPPSPTQADARAAYLALAEVFADFPYVAPEQASVPIAALLTVLASAAIQGSRPGFVFEASAGGTGKTLQTDAIAGIATGRPASRKAYPASDEECEKVFAAYAVRGSPLISIDDIKRPLGGENLDRVLTARGDVDFRDLGKTKILTLPWVATMLFTGVNIAFTGQMARRVCTCRIESRLERPQDRQDFKHPELLAWINTTERPRLVVAALTLLRAYAAAGYPDAGLKRWGSFEEWSRLIPHAIVFAGGPDVLEFRPPDDGENVDAALLHAILSGLELLCQTEAPRRRRSPGEGLTSGEIVAALYAPATITGCFQGTSEAAKQLRTALREVTGTKATDDPSPQAVGTNLALHKGRPLRVDGRLVRLVKVTDKTKRVGDRWAVEVVT